MRISHPGTFDQVPLRTENESIFADGLMDKWALVSIMSQADGQSDEIDGGDAKINSA